MNPINWWAGIIVLSLGLAQSSAPWWVGVLIGFAYGLFVPMKRKAK